MHLLFFYKVCLVIWRNTLSSAPDHIVINVLSKFIRCFVSFNIVYLYKGDPARDDQPPACG